MTTRQWLQHQHKDLSLRLPPVTGWHYWQSIILMTTMTLQCAWLNSEAGREKAYEVKLAAQDALQEGEGLEISNK
jgi:hypothetical protein